MFCGKNGIKCNKVMLKKALGQVSMSAVKIYVNGINVLKRTVKKLMML